jgi:hypothetical protein
MKIEHEKQVHGSQKMIIILLKCISNFAEHAYVDLAFGGTATV